MTTTIVLALGSIGLLVVTAAAWLVASAMSRDHTTPTEWPSERRP